MKKYKLSALTGWAFDLESTPNFFSVIFEDMQSDRVMKFYEFGKVNFRRQLANFMFTEIRKAQGVLNLYGYNSKGYDIPVLKAYLLGATPLECWYLTSSIIGQQRGKPVSNIFFPVVQNRTTIRIDKPSVMDAPKWWLPDQLLEIQGVKNHDLQHCMSLDPNSPGTASLKHVAIKKNWPWIKDLPYPPNHKVESFDQVGEYMEYNTNDVNITKMFGHDSVYEIETRYAIERSIGIPDGVSYSRSSLANVLMVRTLPTELGITAKELKAHQTVRDSVLLGDCIADNIVFETDTFKDFLNRLKVVRVNTEKGTKPKTELEKNFDGFVWFDGVPYQLAMGGLHSVDKLNPCVIMPKSDEILVDGDVSSFYPFIILNNLIYPEHFGPQFLDAYRKFVETRIKAKKSGDKAMAEALKIVVNSIYGKFKSETHWLYDPKASFSVTLNGQLALFMWIEQLVLAGHKVFSANTDGVTAKVKDMDSYIGVCESWMKQLNYNLEFARYERVARRDVNSYLADISAEGEIVDGQMVWTPTKKIKKKGEFLYDSSASKGAKIPPISPMAIEKFFVNEIPVEETVYGSDNIYDFCKSQKIGDTFTPYFEDSRGNRTVLQKTNRYVYAIGENAGNIIKVKSDGSETKLTTYPSIVVNDLRDGEAEALAQVDRMAYIRETMRIINQVNQVEESEKLY